VVLTDWERRHYACACQRHDETVVYRIGGESDDLYPLELTEWVCAGHPDLVLPATLDGVRLDAATDWDALAAEAILSPPFAPPRVELAWTTRLYRLLGAERVLLSRAVAGLLTAEDPRLVRGAHLFFFNEREAEGADRIAAHVAARKDWLSTAPNPDHPGYSMINYAAMLLHERLRLVDEAGGPVDRLALDVAKDLTLAGIGPSHTPHAFSIHDPDWLVTPTRHGWRAPTTVGSPRWSKPRTGFPRPSGTSSSTTSPKQHRKRPPPRSSITSAAADRLTARARTEIPIHRDG
jgi:hypothetical protein